MTQQEDLWKGEFGNSYQDRNEITEEDIKNRQRHWNDLLQVIYGVTGYLPQSILEIGAGQGPNMLALEKLSLQIQKPIKLYATEINQKARIKLSENVKTLEILDQIPNEPIADLVFTYGVMIHTHPAHLRELMSIMHKASKRFLLCSEYFASITTPKTYRGEKDALWLDDYGSHFLNHFRLRLVGCSFSWKRITGLDNVTNWVFEKTEKMQ